MHINFSSSSHSTDTQGKKSTVDLFKSLKSSSFSPLFPALHPLRLIKSSAEINIMRANGKLTGRAFVEV
jgi:Xaa-Pro aminopeptidase